MYLNVFSAALVFQWTSSAAEGVLFSGCLCIRPFNNSSWSQISLQTDWGNFAIFAAYVHSETKMNW